MPKRPETIKYIATIKFNNPGMIRINIPAIRESNG
jgi:hypothetical protein